MSASNKEQVFSILRDNGPFLRDLGVKRCGLFGSFARGEQDAGSDVDILVTPESLSRHTGPRILREVEYEQVAA